MGVTVAGEALDDVFKVPSNSDVARYLELKEFPEKLEEASKEIGARIKEVQTQLHSIQRDTRGMTSVRWLIWSWFNKQEVKDLLPRLDSITEWLTVILTAVRLKVLQKMASEVGESRELRMQM